MPSVLLSDRMSLFAGLDCAPMGLGCVFDVLSGQFGGMDCVAGRDQFSKLQVFVEGLTCTGAGGGTTGDSLHPCPDALHHVPRVPVADEVEDVFVECGLEVDDRAAVIAIQRPPRQVEDPTELPDGFSVGVARSQFCRRRLERRSDLKGVGDIGIRGFGDHGALAGDQVDQVFRIQWSWAA